MNQHDIEAVFHDRRIAYDPSEGGKLMQIFRTPIYKSESEARELHAWAIFFHLFFGVPCESLGPSPYRTMAGLVFLAGTKGQIPNKWHIEYLVDRWFKKVSCYHPGDTEPPFEEYVTECRIVVDEWANFATLKQNNRMIRDIFQDKEGNERVLIEGYGTPK